MQTLTLVLFVKQEQHCVLFMTNVSVCQMGMIRIVVITNVLPVHQRKAGRYVQLMASVSVCRMDIVQIVVIKIVVPVLPKKEQHCVQMIMQEAVSVCRKGMVQNVMIIAVSPVPHRKVRRYVQRREHVSVSQRGIVLCVMKKTVSLVRVGKHQPVRVIMEIVRVFMNVMKQQNRQMVMLGHAI